MVDWDQCLGNLKSLSASYDFLKLNSESGEKAESEPKIPIPKKSSNGLHPRYSWKQVYYVDTVLMEQIQLDI